MGLLKSSKRGHSDRGRGNHKEKDEKKELVSEKKIEDIEDEFVDYVSPLGITKHRLYTDDGKVEFIDDPGWEYVYNEFGDSVWCPVCDCTELRYHNGHCCCIECDTVFTDQEIDDWADEWYHR